MEDNQDAKMTEDKAQSTWKTESGKEYPLYAFDQPQTVTLPNGTVHRFRLWDTVTEKKREDLLKTIVLTSPAIVNGEQPRDVKTDFTRSALGYYEMMIESVSGVQFNGNSPTDWLDAKQLTGDVIPYSVTPSNPDGKPARIMDMLSVGIRKNAAARLYSGRIEVEKPEEEEEFEGNPFDEDDLTRAVERAEQKKTVYTLTLDRTVIVKQEIGVEAIGTTGRFTEPTQLIRHHFREPNGEEFSKWELKARRGWALSLKKGGERQEVFYNLDTISELYDSLIQRVEGASINGSAFELASDPEDAGRKAFLAAVPLPIKKLTVATLFNEMNILGNA